MATKTIAWQTGTGNITVTYSGSGNDTVTVASDANNLYQSRSQSITVKTTDNAISRSVTITQEMREPNFNTSDGYWFITSDDKYFTVQD